MKSQEKTLTQSIITTMSEVTFAPDQIIVSKTDLQGRMTYCNDIFLEVAGYTEAELLGKQHNIIRHPDMPRSIFYFLWQTIGAEDEIFAYVKNRTKRGDYYWVLAHVTPSYGMDGKLSGYHSNRRVPDKGIIQNTIIPLYSALLEIEKNGPSHKEGMANALRHLEKVLAESDISYAEFISKLAFAA